jgi:hypothetical protein
MIGTFDKLLQQRASSESNLLGSLFSGELSKAIKTTSFFFNIPKVVSSSLEALGVSANSTINLFKDGKISEIKVSDVLVASLTPVVKPLVSFMIQSMGVQAKHLGDLVNDIGKLSGLSNNAIQALLDSFGLHTTNQSIIKKVKDSLATIKAFMGTTTASLHLALLQVRNFMETIKYSLDEYWSKFFVLSPRELFQAYLLPVLPPFLTDIADKVFSRIKSFMHSIIVSIASYTNKYLLTPIADRVKGWFKRRKEDEEEAILEKLLPKELYDVVKTTENLLEIVGIKVPSLLKSIAVGSLIAYSKHRSVLQKVEDKIKPESNILKKLFESDIVQILLNSMSTSTNAVVTGGRGGFSLGSLFSRGKPTESGQQSPDEKKKRGFAKILKYRKKQQEELIKTREKLIKTSEELEKKYVKLAEDISKIQYSSLEVSEKLRKQLEETAELIRNNDEKISQIDNELKNLREQQKESKSDEMCNIVSLIQKAINEKFEAFASATGGSLNLVVETVRRTSNALLNTLSATVSKVSETLQNRGINTKSLVNTMNDIITNARESVHNISSQVSEKVYSVYKSISQKVKTLKLSGMSVVSGIRNVISRTFQKLKKCNFDIFGKLTTFITFLMGGVSKIFSFIKDSIFNISKLESIISSVWPKNIFGKAALTFFALKSVKFIDDKFLHGKITNFITESIPEFFSSLWQKMKDTFFGFIDKVAKFLHIDKVVNIFEKVMSFFSRMWQSIKESLQPAIDVIKSALQSLKDAIAPVIVTIKRVISKISESVGSLFSSPWDKTKEIASSTVEKASKFTATAGRVVSTTLQEIIASRAPSPERLMKNSYIKDSMAAIVAASQVTGVPLETLLGVSYIESTWNPNAKNQDSSASGLFQFLTSSKGSKGSVWQSVSKKVPVNSIYGNIGDVTNPYRNALAAAINIKSMGEYASTPELAYVKHFIPALAPYIENIVRNRRTNETTIYPLLHAAYMKQYPDAQQREKIIRKIIDLNPLFFRKIEPEQTTVAEFLQRIRNRLYPGIKTGLEIVNRLKDDVYFRQKVATALASLGKNVAFNFNSLNSGLNIGTAAGNAATKASDIIRNEMKEQAFSVASAATAIEQKVKQQQEKIAQSGTSTPLPPGAPQLLQANRRLDPIDRAIELATRTIDTNVDWSLLKLSNLPLPS